MLEDPGRRPDTCFGICEVLMQLNNIKNNYVCMSSLLAPHAHGQSQLCPPYLYVLTNEFHFDFMIFLKVMFQASYSFCVDLGTDTQSKPSRQQKRKRQSGKISVLPIPRTHMTFCSLIVLGNNLGPERYKKNIIPSYRLVFSIGIIKNS